MGVKILGDQSHEARKMSKVTIMAKEDTLKRIVGIIRRVLKRLPKQQPLKDVLLVHWMMEKFYVQSHQ